MKKLLSVILIGVLMTSSLPVFAQQGEEMQEVLLSVKTRIIDTEDFEEFNSSVMESDGEKNYSFDWHSNVDDKYKSLSITASDDGIITNYRFYDDNTNSYTDTPSLNKMSSDEALIKAQQLIDKLNPMIAGEIIAEKTSNTESLFDNSYRFNLQRYYNNVPVYNNTGYVTVNFDATQITRYNLNYTEGLSFESSDNVISVADAWKYYYKNVGAELEYRVEYKDEEKNIYLAYIPKLGFDEYIDAKTGDVTQIWQRDYYFGGSGGATNLKAMAMDAATEESARLSEIEIEKLEEVAGLKSREDAQNAIKNNYILDFGDNLILNSINLYKDYNGKRYYYDLAFESHSDETYRYAFATLDAETLEIIRWRSRTKDYIEYYKADNSTEIDKTDVENKAIDALKILAPECAEYKPTENQEASNRIGYVRYVNDIKFSNDYINLEINPENGKVWNFSMNYTDVQFPSPEGIISEEQAIEKMSEKSEMTLYYFPSEEVAKPGYKNSEVSEIDAFNGEIKDYREEQDKLNYTDISDHYAKEQIETLAKFGIGFEGEEFKPDEVITLNEYITLLVSTSSNYTPIVLKASNEVTYEFKEAQRNGIIKIDEVNPDETLTRENAAIYMIRVMGLEEVAKLDTIYKSVFSDVTQNVGYISILGAMGVFNGDENGLFNPNQNLTRADAAIIIYNYLSR